MGQRNGTFAYFVVVGASGRKLRVSEILKKHFKNSGTFNGIITESAAMKSIHA